jgi:hypothetical protein
MAGLDRLTLPATVALHLDLDLDEPVADGSVAGPEPEQKVVMTLDPSLGDLRGLIVAGPGVVRSGSVEGLVALAAATGTMLVCDAWFDVVTSSGGAERAEAVAEAAFAEIPLAAICAYIVLEAERFEDWMRKFRPPPRERGT